MLILPDTLAVGNIISYSHKQFIREQIYDERYTFAGGVFFDRMKELGLYLMDTRNIENRVVAAGLKGIFT